MNYKHLHYFWTVLRAGGIVRASEQLHLTPQTLSGQIKQLEERIGQPLLRKVGRGVEPTDAGRLVMRYADDIFALGASMQEALATGRDARRTAVLRVGIADSVPKAVAFHVLEPAMALPEPPRLACHEGGLTGLLGELAVHRLDLVVSDVPAPVNLSVRVYTHLLGRTGVAFFAAPRLLQATGWTLRRARSTLSTAPFCTARVPVFTPDSRVWAVKGMTSAPSGSAVSVSSAVNSSKAAISVVQAPESCSSMPLTTASGSTPRTGPTMRSR